MIFFQPCLCCYVQTVCGCCVFLLARVSCTVVTYKQLVVFECFRVFVLIDDDDDDE